MFSLSWQLINSPLPTQLCNIPEILSQQCFRKSSVVSSINLILEVFIALKKHKTKRNKNHFQKVSKSCMSSFTHSNSLNFRTHGTFVILSSTLEHFIHLLSDPQESPSRVSGFSRTKLHWYDQRVWKVDRSQLCSTARQWICCDLQLHPQAPPPSAPRSHHWQTHQTFCTKIIITRISVDLYMSMIKCRGKLNSCIWNLMPSQAQCWETIGRIHLKSGWHTFINNETLVTFSLFLFLYPVCLSVSIWTAEMKGVTTQIYPHYKTTQNRYISTLYKTIMFIKLKMCTWLQPNKKSTEAASSKRLRQGKVKE